MNITGYAIDLVIGVLGLGMLALNVATAGLCPEYDQLPDWLVHVDGMAFLVIGALALGLLIAGLG